MNSIDYDIQDKQSKKDFTIIYKGKSASFDSESECLVEINTSKIDLIQKLHYFKRKMSEMHHVNEIFIHDRFHIDVFQEFIESITSKHIQINSKNCNELFDLGTKYEYHEIIETAQKYIEERPDIKIIVDEISLKNSDENLIDPNKEEIISKNLDICIKNGFLDRIQLPALIRILNSPHRVLKDHHLLFNFVMKKLNSNEKENGNFEILPSCLDYNQMTNEEINELINKENIYYSIFKPKNENDLMRNLFIQSNEKNSKFEQQISELFIKYSQIKQNCDEMNQKYEQQSILIKNQDKIIQSFNEKYEQQNNEIKKLQETINQQEKIISKYISTAQEKNDQQSNLIKNQKKEVNKGKEIPFAGSSLNGIFSYLQDHSNINDEIKITCSDNFNIKNSVLQIYNTKDYFESDNNSDSWLCFEFKSHLIIPTNYTLRASNRGKDSYNPRSWVIEGSKNNRNPWTKLDEQNNCESLRNSSATYTFPIQNTNRQKFRFLRMRITGPSWCHHKDNNRLLISSIEFYGELI